MPGTRAIGIPPARWRHSSLEPVDRLVPESLLGPCSGESPVVARTLGPSCSLHWCGIVPASVGQAADAAPATGYARVPLSAHVEDRLSDRLFTIITVVVFGLSASTGIAGHKRRRPARSLVTSSTRKGCQCPGPQSRFLLTSAAAAP
jgi:hypothetical protein